MYKSDSVQMQNLMAPWWSPKLRRRKLIDPSRIYWVHKTSPLIVFEEFINFGHTNSIQLWKNYNLLGGKGKFWHYLTWHWHRQSFATWPMSNPVFANLISPDGTLLMNWNCLYLFIQLDLFRSSVHSFFWDCQSSEFFGFHKIFNKCWKYLVIFTIRVKQLEMCKVWILVALGALNMIPLFLFLLLMI